MLHCSKKVLVAIVVIFDILIFLCVYMYKSTDFTKTCSDFYVNGVDCSSKSVDDIVKMFDEKYGSREVTIKVNTDTYKCRVDDLVDVKFSKKVIEDKIKTTGVLRYFYTDENIELDYNDYYIENDEKCEKWLENNILIHKVESTNAYINRKSQTEFEIIPATLGTDFNVEDVVKITYDTINESKNDKDSDISLDYTGYCKKADILADNKELVDKYNKINKYMTTVITMTFGDNKKVIDKEELSKHIDDTGKISYKWIGEYVDELAKELYTVGRERNFTTHNHKKIKVKGGIYGWIVDTETTKKTLKKAIKKGGVIDYTPEFKQTAMGWGKDEIGDTYIEVSIAQQKIWYYRDGKKKFESSVVTGLDGDSNRRTLRGVHFVMYKLKDTYLKGATWNTHVNYFIPFNYSGQGFHDASWRSVFGGNIYLSNGSHGCVNMPPSKAGELYQLVEQGTPVVVY